MVENEQKTSACVGECSEWLETGIVLQCHRSPIVFRITPKLVLCCRWEAFRYVCPKPGGQVTSQVRGQLFFDLETVELVRSRCSTVRGLEHERIGLIGPIDHGV